MLLMQNHSTEYLQYLCGQFEENNRFKPEMYTTYDVKRGLRNADGTGVRAGLTFIGDVHGYIVSEGERIPVEGKLTYRGIDINDLIEGFVKDDRFGFEETAYLLLVGKLPTAAELKEFTRIIGDHRPLPENFTEDMIIKAPSVDIMNKLARATLALYSYDDNPDDCSLQNLYHQAISLIARYPAIIAHSYRTKKHYFDHKSLVLHNPSPDKTTAENLLAMARPDGNYTQEEAKLLDLCLVLHAEHGGGNNSAFTCRVLSSSGTDTYSAIAAAVGSLKGPKHGGANIKVEQMFADIREHVTNWDSEGEVADYLVKLINRQAGDRSGLIYGIGHAIYTLSDPRAVLLKKYARKLAEQKGYLDEFNLIELVERLTPEIFASVKGDSKVMCANVDMYSGLVYKTLGIPRELYTPLFAASRIVGWMAHRIEEVQIGGRIMRPAYKSLSRGQAYNPILERKA